jgi:hypothetical protein
VRLVPYIQRARLGNLKGTERGLRLEHHFDMAGVLETHWGAGASDRERSGALGAGGKKAGYVRTGFFVDALGRVNLDAMFRLDGEENSHAAPSAMSGFRLPLDPFVVEMGFHRSAWWTEDFAAAVTTRGRCAQNFLGLRFKPGLSGCLALRAVRDSDGSGPSYGLLPSASWEKRLPAGFAVRSLKLEGIGDWRKETGTAPERSSGLWARATLGFRAGVLLWGGCRAHKNAAGSAFFGASWKGKRLAARLDLENAGDVPIAWPEPGVESGRTFRGSLEAFL